MASGLASFLGRRNVVAPAITVSTIQGSSITTASITTGALSLSTLTGSTINASSITFSSLTGSTITTSTITSNMLTLSTLTVSSINSGAPGVAAYSTFNASSINTSSITASSITTASGYNSNIGNVLYTSLADSGQTAASFTAASLPATAPAGSVISGSYRLTAGASSGAAVMRLSSYTFVVGTTYNFTFTGMQGSQALALYVYQYNSAGTASIQISASVYSITTSAATVSGSFTPNASGTYTGTIVFYFQALEVNQYVNFTAFSMTVGSMNVGIGMSNPIAKLQINQDGNSTANEVGSHSMGILSNQGTSGTNLMYMMLDADYTNQCCSIQSIIYGLKTWNLNLNPRGGNVGIGITNPSAILHVSDSLTTATSIPLMLFSPNLSTGGSQYLYFGTANSANNSAQIGWANVGAGSASNYAFLQIYGKANIMTWQASTGNVGIGLTNPTNRLDTFDGVARTGTHATGRALYATFNGAEYSNGIAEFRHTNGTQGVGIGYAGLYACGSNTDQEFNIIAKGTGLINLRSATRLTGVGDNCMTYYGPNATWSAYLVVGSGADKAGASTAQVITTNGNLHLDGGNSNSMYYGYYANSRGTPNSHEFYGSAINFNSGLPQNSSPYSGVVCMDGNSLRRSQAVNRLVYFNNNVAWSGGVNMVNAFYLYNTACSVYIWGKNSGYYTGGGMMQTTIRCYSQSAGTYYYFPINAYVNNGYNHFTVPLDYATTFPYTGWYDIYVYSTSGWITDGNDQLTIGVTILPVSGF